MTTITEDTTDDATLVSTGTSVSGRLETAGDSDFFRVEIESTGKIAAYTTGSADTTGRLFSLDRTTDVRDDDGGSGTNFRIETDIAEGTYYVEVAGYEEAVGEYTLHIEFEEDSLVDGDDHGDSKATATATVVNSTIGGMIEEQGDRDYFTFDLNTTGELIVFTTGRLDTFGRLTSADGAVRKSNDDGGEGTNFRIEVDAHASTYHVEVRGFGLSTGELPSPHRIRPGRDDGHSRWNHSFRICGNRSLSTTGAPQPSPPLLSLPWTSGCSFSWSHRGPRRWERTSSFSPPISSFPSARRRDRHLWCRYATGSGKGDETADLQIVSGEGEDGQSARSISIQIEDDFDGSGQVIEPRVRDSI